MAAKRKNYDLAVEMYVSGFSIAQIAEKHNVSRQSMHKSLKRRGVNFRSNLRFGKDNHFYRGGKKAIDAVHNKVENAIKCGVLINPGKCQWCSCSGKFKDGRTSIQAHHCDYNKPLDVMWLCQKCHHEWHKNNKPIELVK